VSKCAVSSVRAPLIGLEEFAFHSFEIVTESSLPLLGLSVPVIPVAVLLGAATTTVVALAGVRLTAPSVAVSFVNGLVEVDLVLLG